MSFLSTYGLQGVIDKGRKVLADDTHHQYDSKKAAQARAFNNTRAPLHETAVNMVENSKRTVDEFKVKLIESIERQYIAEAELKFRAELHEKVFANEAEVLEEYKEAIKEHIMAECKEEIKARAETTLIAELEPAIKAQLAERFANEIRAQMAIQLQKEEPIMRQKLMDELYSVVKKELAETHRQKFTYELRQVLRKEELPVVRETLKKELEAPVRQEIYAMHYERVHQEVKQHWEEELQDTVRREMFANCEHEVREELRGTLRREVKQELKAKYEPIIKKNLTKDLEAQVKGQLINMYDYDVRVKLEHDLEPEIRNTLEHDLEPSVRKQIEDRLEPVIRHQIEDRLQSTISANHQSHSITSTSPELIDHPVQNTTSADHQLQSITSISPEQLAQALAHDSTTTTDSNQLGDALAPSRHSSTHKEDDASHADKRSLSVSAGEGHTDESDLKKAHVSTAAVHSDQPNESLASSQDAIIKQENGNLHTHKRSLSVGTDEDATNDSRFKKARLSQQIDNDRDDEDINSGPTSAKLSQPTNLEKGDDYAGSSDSRDNKNGLTHENTNGSRHHEPNAGDLVSGTKASIEDAETVLDRAAGHEIDYSRTGAKKCSPNEQDAKDSDAGEENSYEAISSRLNFVNDYDDRSLYQYAKDPSLNESSVKDLDSGEENSYDSEEDDDNEDDVDSLLDRLVGNAPITDLYGNVRSQHPDEQDGQENVFSYGPDGLYLVPEQHHGQDGSEESRAYKSDCTDGVAQENNEQENEANLDDACLQQPGGVYEAAQQQSQHLKECEYDQDLPAYAQSREHPDTNIKSGTHHEAAYTGFSEPLNAMSEGGDDSEVNYPHLSEPLGSITPVTQILAPPTSFSRGFKRSLSFEYDEDDYSDPGQHKRIRVGTIDDQAVNDFESQYLTESDEGDVTEDGGDEEAFEKANEMEANLDVQGNTQDNAICIDSDDEDLVVGKEDEEDEYEEEYEEYEVYPEEEIDEGETLVEDSGFTAVGGPKMKLDVFDDDDEDDEEEEDEGDEEDDEDEDEDESLFIPE